MTKTDSGQDHPRTHSEVSEVMGAPQIHPVVMDDHDVVLKPW